MLIGGVQGKRCLFDSGLLQYYMFLMFSYLVFEYIMHLKVVFWLVRVRRWMHPDRSLGSKQLPGRRFST